MICKAVQCPAKPALRGNPAKPRSCARFPTREAARSYLEDLCESGQISPRFTLDDAAFDLLVEELGWLSPYYLRQIALQLRPTGPAGSVTNDDIQQAFTKLLSPSQRTHFAVWGEHIDKNFGAVDTGHLHTILDVACEARDGEIEASFLTRLSHSGQILSQSGLRALLRILESDGLLHQSDKRWAFRSGLLRRYWKEYMRSD